MILENMAMLLTCCSSQAITGRDLKLGMAVKNPQSKGK